MTGTVNESGRDGLVTFAATLLFVLGALNVINGIAVLANSEWVVFTQDGAWLLDFTTWGWVTLILGVIELVIGWGLLNASQMAKITGMVLAVIAAINAIFIIPIYAVWGIIALALSVMVLYGLSADKQNA